MTTYQIIRPFKAILRNATSYREAFKKISKRLPSTYGIKPIFRGDKVSGLSVWNFNGVKTDLIFTPIKFE